MSQLPLTALRTFEVAARHLNFSRAAEEMFVTQSAVSHQVRRLETWLEQPLFSRTGNELRLLPAGQELADTLTVSLGHIDQACARLRAAQRPLPVVVAAIPSIATNWLVPRLRQFQDAHPGTDLRIEYALHGQSIDYHEVDFAITYGDRPPDASGATAEVYLPGISCAVANPAIADMPGIRALNPARLNAVGLLHDITRRGWERWFAATGLAPDAVGEGTVYHDFNLLRAAVLAGQGIALCPLAIIGPDLAAGRLIRLSDVTVGAENHYYLSQSTIRRPGTDAGMQAFGRWVRGLAVAAGIDSAPSGG